MKTSYRLFFSLFITAIFFVCCRKENTSDTYSAAGDNVMGNEKYIPLPKIVSFRASDHTFLDANGNPFFPWGFNYTNPVIVDLVEDHWEQDTIWNYISRDFSEMKAYGANVVRIHLQYNKFMKDPYTPDAVSFTRLKRIVHIAETRQLYLLITGLGAYRAADQPLWYDSLSRDARWQTQALFWKAIAATVKNNSVVFAYDLMNEPVVASHCPGPDCDWLPGDDFGGYNFVQNISLKLRDLLKPTMDNWIAQMTDSIRTVDKKTLITVGLLPLGTINEYADNLDFISTHIYPETGHLQTSENFVTDNQSDKPFLLEEISNLACDTTQLTIFLNDIPGKYNGLIGHYLGKTKKECHESGTIPDLIQAQFINWFQDENPNKK
ncbi:MAG: cellulase family glycosylhydrolase [Parafilimonas sp.]